MFRARNQHATGTSHGKTTHGSILLNAYDKSPLLTISQKGPEDMTRRLGHVMALHNCKQWQEWINFNYI